MKKFLIAILLPTAFFLSGCNESGPNAMAPNAPEVGVYTVKSEEVPLYSDVPGRTTAYRVAEVRPQVNGIVLKRKFEEGSLVQEGDELYQIDSDVYKASYDKAVAHMENLGRTAKRKASLRNQNSISAQDYENSLYAWEQAKADMELARLNLHYTNVTAPLSGRIGKSTITEGALVTNGQAQAMAVINQIDPIFVDLTPSVLRMLITISNLKSADNTEHDMSFYQNADVWLTLEDGSVYPLAGKIKFLDNEVDQATGTIKLRAEFPNPNEQLIPGMYVRARVMEGLLEEGIVIPHQALVRGIKGEAQVWLLDENNMVSLQTVTADRTIGNTWLVTSGLKSGDRVVTEGVQRLMKGITVSPRDAANIDVNLTFKD